MLVQFANILLRQAGKTENPRQYLDDLITSKLSSLTALGGNITSTTVNGKSVTIQAPAGMSLSDQLAAAELALGCLERGLKVVPRTTYGVLR